jgi:ribosomal protein L44E
MSQHYTKNTVSVSAFCPKCKKPTQHRIDGHKIGPCLDCLARPIVKAAPRVDAQQQFYSESNETTS